MMRIVKLENVPSEVVEQIKCQCASYGGYFPNNYAYYMPRGYKADKNDNILVYKYHKKEDGTYTRERELWS
jgi:hypothetical protein